MCVKRVLIKRFNICTKMKKQLRLYGNSNPVNLNCTVVGLMLEALLYFVTAFICT